MPGPSHATSNAVFARSRLAPSVRAGRGHLICAEVLIVSLGGALIPPAFAAADLVAPPMTPASVTPPAVVRSRPATLLSSPVPAGAPATFLLLEPAPDPPAACVGLRPLRPASDPVVLARVRPWLAGEAARWALDVYSLALAAAPGEVAARQPAGLPIAVLADGIGAATGFCVVEDGHVRAWPQAAYIQLASEEWRFRVPLLHETGHVALAVVGGGRDRPRRDLATLPHTLPMLSDRATAFSEGFAIHLEALLAHFGTSSPIRRQFWRDELSFGPSLGLGGEFFHVPAELFTYAQGLARYQAVRDNQFAFSPSFTEADYLRVQLDPSRDFAALRNPDQLLQAEGFVASVFFSLMARGAAPSAETVRIRLARMFEVLAVVLATPPGSPDEPLLLATIQTHLRLHPEDAVEIADVILDLSHGAFVDPEAPRLWRELYLAALRLDLAAPVLDEVRRARTRWRAAVLADPAVLRSRLGPQLRCSVPECTVRLIGFNHESPLVFDLNTAEIGTIRLVPGISESEVAAWLAARQVKPFASVDDFRTRAGLRAETLVHLQF